MSSTPGYLAVSGIEAANNARTAAYLQAGLGSPQFEVVYSAEICPELTDLAYPLEVCDSPTYASQFYENPIGDWRSAWDGSALTPLSGPTGGAYNETLLDDFDVAANPAPGWTGDMRGILQAPLRTVGGYLQGNPNPESSGTFNTVFQPDMEAQITLGPAWNGDDFELWVRCRNPGVVGSFEGYLAWYDSSVPAIRFQKYGPGSTGSGGPGYVTLATLGTHTLQAGNRILLRATSTGSRVALQVWLAADATADFVLHGTTTDTSSPFLLGGQIGFLAYGQTANYANLRGGTINASCPTHLEDGTVAASTAYCAGPRAAWVFPDPGETDVTVTMAYDAISRPPLAPRVIMVGRMVNVGAGAQVGWVSTGLSFDGGTFSAVLQRRAPGGAVNVDTTLSATVITWPAAASVPVPIGWFLEWRFTSTAVTFTIYGADPRQVVAPAVIYTVAYGYNADPTSAWAVATGQTEAAAMATATEVAMCFDGTTGSVPENACARVSSLVIEPTRSAVCGSSYPAAGAWPGDNQFPARYGTFTNPGADNAPWVDPSQPASYGYLGALLYDLENYDSTETRTLDQAASGRGGILGPQMMAPRHLTGKGWAIAQDCEAMEYARRWLADILAGELCPGCDAVEIDLLPLCGGADASGVRRLYDAGLEQIEFDTSDVNSCCYVTPFSFTMAVADPFIYTLPETVIAGQALAPLAADTPAIAFDSWLFANPDEICVELADEGLGTDAAIVTLTGGDTGISGGLVYQSQGHYPQASMFPGECVYPADGTPQWDITQCPFVFSITLGPGEVFVVNSSRQLVEWWLADGTVLNGAPKLALAPGQTIQWIDTCDGDDAQVCVRASANCTCDTSAAVVVATQHSER